VLADYVVYRAQVSAFQHPAELYDALDLGHRGSEFSPAGPDVYVVRLARAMDIYLIR
jgi:hypothetical protein